MADFSDAAAFVAADNPAAAVALRHRINDVALRLGARPTGRPGRVPGTYEKSVQQTRFIIAYALTDDAVTILRVIHTARDWPPRNRPTDAG